jgi:uncharacterized tellurite resistance protein B-like protein
MSIWKWLGLPGGGGAADEDDGLVEIEKALSGMPPERARFIACFAYILTRGARADHMVSDHEMHSMERFVSERGGISTGDAQLVVHIARAHSKKSGGTDDFLVTREFNAIATRDQKLALLDCLFAVSAADTSIVTAEDNEIRRIANELKLEHGDYIAIRAQHLHNLEVLRDKGQAPPPDDPEPGS